MRKREGKENMSPKAIITTTNFAQHENTHRPNTHKTVYLLSDT